MTHHFLATVLVDTRNLRFGHVSEMARAIVHQQAVVSGARGSGPHLRHAHDEIKILPEREACELVRAMDNLRGGAVAP